MENSDLGASQALGLSDRRARCSRPIGRTGRRGREGNSRQCVGMRQVVVEVVAQRQNCNTRERCRASYDFAANRKPEGTEFGSVSTA